MHCVCTERQPSCVPGPEESDKNLFYKGSNLSPTNGLTQKSGFVISGAWTFKTQYTRTMDQSLLGNTVL